MVRQSRLRRFSTSAEQPVSVRKVRSPVRTTRVAPASQLTRVGTRAVPLGAAPALRHVGVVHKVRAEGALTTRRMLDEYLLYVGDPPAVVGRASLT